MAIPNSGIPATGPTLQDGNKLNAAIANGLRNYFDAITALAGGGAAGAPQLVYGVNKVTTVASGNDSVQLPPSIPGASVIVENNGGGNSLQVFANVTSSLPTNVLDTINGTAGATGVAVANGKTAIFNCTAYGAWWGPVALA
jgi:hypothetical protein